MSRRKKPERGEGRTTTLTLHLGTTGREQLDRCRQLIHADVGGPDLPTRGEIVRVAVRCLLMQLLGRKANLANAEDRYTQEYLSVMDSQVREERENAP